MTLITDIASILDPTGKLANELVKPRTGIVGAIAQADLPDGWVAVTYWPGHDDRESVEYSGPVLHESYRTILLEINGEPLSILKRWCAITRPNGDAA